MLEAIFTENVLTVTLAGLYQWDYGQKLYIKGLELGETEQIHFSNNKEKEAIVMPLVKHGEHYVCDIPNELLEKWLDITAWVYDVGEKSGETVRTIILKIEQRVKPQDFISTNPDATEILGDVLNKIDKNIKDNAVFKDDISKQQENFTTTMTQEHAQHKQQVDETIARELSKVYRPCGSVDTVANLPKDAKVGDVYDVLESGTNWVWTGEKWDSLAGAIDLSNFYTKEQTYHKAEVDTKIGAVEDSIVSTTKSVFIQTGEWIQKVYTLRDELITTNSIQTLSKPEYDPNAQAMFDAIADAKIEIVKDSQTNGQLQLICTGDVPNVAVEILVIFWGRNSFKDGNEVSY